MDAKNNHQLNYWLLTTELPPEYGGGIGTYCIHTAKMLSQKGHKLTIFIRDFSISSYTINSIDGYRVIRFSPNICKETNLGYDAHLSYAYAEIVKIFMENEGVPDVLEAQEYAGIAYYILQFRALSYPKFEDLTVLITLHAPSFLYLEYNQVPIDLFPYFWTGEMEKFVIRAADKLISPSSFLIPEIQKRISFDLSDTQVVVNPFEMDATYPSVAGNQYFFFGKLTPQKGCLNLIEQFVKRWNNNKSEILCMIGGGDHYFHPANMDMHSYIKSKYSKYIRAGLLILKGSIPPSQINNLIQNSKAIIIPSLVDNLPYTVLESMNQGRLVIASRQGGQSEVIESNINGFLYDTHNPIEFHAILDKLNYQDQEELTSIQLNAQKTIQLQYNYNTVYEEKIAVVHALITKSANRTSPLKKLFFPFIQQYNSPNLSVNDSNDTPLLSIIIPYFNMEKYIEDCLDSLTRLQRQNYRYEILVIDDGSNEESSDFLTSLKSKYNFTVYRTINQGLSLTRNYGASLANGDYIAFLDADDTVHPEYYAKAMRVLTRNSNVFFVGCWAKYFELGHKIWPSFQPEPPYLLVHNPINSSALVLRKDAFLNYGLNDPSFIYGMEDYDSVINMVKNGCPGVVLPEPLWNYRIRKNSMARQFTIEKQLFLYRLLSTKHRDFFSSYASEIINLLHANGPGMHFDNPSISYDLKKSNLLFKLITPKLLQLIKRQPLLRKVAIRIKKFL